MESESSVPPTNSRAAVSERRITTMSKTLIRISLLAALLMVVCGHLVAQGQSEDVHTQLQTLVKNHPEAVDQLKALLARQLQKEGSAIDPQAITNTMLVARLESDAV